MSIPGAANPLLLATAAAGGYQISRSLRFNSSDSAYLSRTPASSGNRKTWTWAGWVKLGKPSTFGVLFDAGAANTDTANLLLRDTGVLQFYAETNPTQQAFLQTSQVLRDYSAWYHIVLAIDTTQATGSNRVKFYLNGSQITAFSTASYPSQNADLQTNAALLHTIGRGAQYQQNFYFDGYLADIHFIDGQALTPSSFTETSATTGQLIPKAYTGSFGTNGFWLKFSDNSAATATTLGKDYSGNSNNWTPNNLSVTAGAGNDSLTDTPTSYGTDTGAGGEVRGNYATLNPLAKGGDIQAPTNGNLQVTSSGSGYGLILGTIGMSSGKWYWEVTTTSANCATGIATNLANLASYGGADAYSWVWASYSGGSNKRNNNTGSSYGSILANGDVVGIAFDADNGTLTFYKNNVSQGAAYTGLATGTYLPVLGDETTAANIDLTVNFGQRPFAYTAPSGFKALVDTNIPVVIAKSSDYFQTVLYTGNGSTQTISGLGFSPDFLWFKARSIAYSHALYDTVRGYTKSLVSNSTVAEGTEAGGLSAFNSDGFSLNGENTVYGSTNTNSQTYVAWAWDAGSTTVTNTQGSITTSVRASASSGFAVITGSTPSSTTNFSFGHNLGIAPNLVIYKHTAVSGNWHVYHRNGGGNNYNLNSTAGPANSGLWSGLDPTSTLITIPSTIISANSSAFVCYAWAPVAGYSSFGSYTGNGSSDGPFVYTGFRPRWVMFKGTNGATGNETWVIKDALRPAYNVTSGNLYANLSNAEDSSSIVDMDFVANGFKLRGTYSGINTSSVNYIFAAFAESPFQYARAR